MTRAIVVGGGHNGLVAAGYLAQAGLEVVVLERRALVGGPCSTLEWFPGYRHSYTNSPGSLEPKIAADLELERFGLRYNRPDPTVLVPFPDGRFFAGRRDRAEQVRELEKFSKHDAVAYYELLDYYAAFARRLRVSLFAPPPSLSELASRMETPEDEEAFAKILFGSIQDLLDERLESEQVKAVLGSLTVGASQAGPRSPGTAYGLLPRPLSLASVAAESASDPRLLPLRGSTGLPVGGMGSIVEAMEHSLRSRGGTVRTHADVVRILGTPDGVTGVALASGEEIAAPIVLSNLNPKLTFLELVPSACLSSDFMKRVEAIKMAGNQFKVVLALDGMPRFACARDDPEARAFAACQFRIAPSLEYMERAWDDAKYGHCSHEPLYWGLTPSVLDPSVAPPGSTS